MLKQATFLTRQGLAGEKDGFFSILLKFPCQPVDSQTRHLRNRLCRVL
jgi:hypothetical protein